MWVCLWRFQQSLRPHSEGVSIWIMYVQVSTVCRSHSIYLEPIKKKKFCHGGKQLMGYQLQKVTKSYM